jgi:hypothetical protein
VTVEWGHSDYDGLLLLSIVEPWQMKLHSLDGLYVNLFELICNQLKCDIQKKSIDNIALISGHVVWLCEMIASTCLLT